MNPGAATVPRWVVLLTAAFLVQVALLGQVSVLGVHPEVMLLFAIAAGLVAGPERGAGVGFAAGVLVDLTLHGTFGLSALAYTVTGFLVGSVKEAVPRISQLLALVVALVASAVGVLLYATVAHLLGEHTLSDPGLTRIVAIVSLWNAALCLPVVWLCRRAEGARSAF